MDAALFLDFDGTLVELESHPSRVAVDASLSELIGRVQARMGGALAMVTGRTVEEIDARFRPHTLSVAGLHGLDMRTANGRSSRGPDAAAMRTALEALRRAVASISLAWVEDKGSVLAVHYREAPAARATSIAAARDVLRLLGPDYRLLEGADVIELMPRDASKGRAVEAFMADAPFRGRRPVFVGDDVTDLDGFEAARRMGGFGIAVGPRVSAEWHLADVGAVREWLERITAGGAA